MAGSFISPQGDLETILITNYNDIDQYVGGSLWVWGGGGSGSLGTNDTTNRSSPVQTVAAGTNWRVLGIAGGGLPSAAIKTDGTLWMWGTNIGGVLGTNDTTARSSPVQTVAGGTNWKQVACGYYHTATIKTDGTLWVWGDNPYGQLATNNTTSRSSPVQTVSAGTNWKSVACGRYHALAIKTDGTLWAWGLNQFGQVGTNDRTARSSPIQTVASGTDWKQVSGGISHSAAIKTDGTLWLWGENTYGTLGTNDITHRSSPVQTVSGGTNWKQVSAGSFTTAAIKTDGTLWTWGENSSGSLGIGVSGNRSSPIQTVSGGNNWKSVSVGNNSQVGAIKTDGTLWMWGFGSNGELGNGSTFARFSPVQTLSGGDNWKQVSAIGNQTLAIHFYDANNLYPSA